MYELFETFDGGINTLSNMLSNPSENIGLSNLIPKFMEPLISQRLSEHLMSRNSLSPAPGYDGWKLDNPAQGILDPLPSYQRGTGPSMASMGYTDPLPSYVKPGFAVPAELEPIIQEAANTYHVPEGLIKAIIKQESNYNPNSTSSAGAVGYMQLMPDTARDAGVTNRRDPRQNIMGATKYIRHIYDKYQNWPLTLAAYNAGPNRRSIRSGLIPNFPETRNYVRRVMAYWGYGW